MADKATDTLDALRTKIDAVDDRLVDLVGERLGLTAQAARLKADGPAWVPWREEAILARVARSGTPAAAPDDLSRFFRQLFSLGRASQGAPPVRAPRKDTLGKDGAPLWEILDPGESIDEPALGEALGQVGSLPRETILVPAQIAWEAGGMSLLPRLAAADLSLHALILRDLSWCIAWRSATGDPRAIHIPAGIEAFIPRDLPHPLGSLPRSIAPSAKAAAEGASGTEVAAVTTVAIADRQGLAERHALAIPALPRRARYLVAAGAPSSPPEADRWTLLVGAPEPAVLGIALATLAQHSLYPTHIEHHSVPPIFDGPIAFLDLVGDLATANRVGALEDVKKVAPLGRDLGAYPVIRL